MASAMAAALTGCSHSWFSDTADDGHHAAPVSLFSPNGEPLNGGGLGNPPCAEAMEGWFKRVDANHDEGIDRPEFMADARVQFQRMDLDQDGFITADELARFRAAYAIERRQPHPEPYPGQAAEGDEAGRRHSRHGPQTGSAGPHPSSPRPGSGEDPVMSADVNLDFKVSLDEFLHQAEDVFSRLDANHDGVLDPSEAARKCS
jgi:hypothetical protein